MNWTPTRQPRRFSTAEEHTAKSIFSGTWATSPQASVILSSTAAGHDTKICPIKQSSRQFKGCSCSVTQQSGADMNSLQLKPCECSLHTGKACTALFYHPWWLFSSGFSTDSYQNTHNVFWHSSQLSLGRVLVHPAVEIGIPKQTGKTKKWRDLKSHLSSAHHIFTSIAPLVSKHQGSSFWAAINYICSLVKASSDLLLHLLTCFLPSLQHLCLPTWPETEIRELPAQRQNIHPVCSSATASAQAQGTNCFIC